MICDYLPKFNITKRELKITKKKLKKFAGVGIIAIFGWLFYTKLIEEPIKGFLFSIPHLGIIFQYEVVQIFLLAIIVFYIKDVID